VSLDLDFDDAQGALADALDQLARDRCDEATVRAAADRFPRGLWSELASLGVFAAGAPGGDGGALEIVAAMESLGRAAFPGPLAATFAAVQVLAGAEREAVVDGASIVAYGEPPLMPFAPIADVFLVVDAHGVRRAEPDGVVEPVVVLGGEPWGRVALRVGPPLAGGARARVVGEIARAAQLAALGRRVVEEAAEHARTRRQFGRAIGDFQAVAHPLADCHMRLAAARTLARAAAWRLDDGDASGAAAASASALLSCAAAAVEAAHVGHQVYGAVGITTEGPAFHLTRRIRQLASASPGTASARDRVLERFGPGAPGASTPVAARA